MTYTNLLKNEIKTRIHMANNVGLVDEVADYVKQIGNDIYDANELQHLALQKKCWLMIQDKPKPYSERQSNILNAVYVYGVILIISLLGFGFSLIINKIFL